jgi:MoaA/NifB/PqqE/SkfB family radical SAM enzyme
MSAAAPSPLPPLPRFAQIEPIGRCNLACRMCTVNERGDAVAELGLDRFTSLLDQLPGLQELHLQGLGEPMLHPGFFDMVRLAVGRGIRVSANTNLTLLTERRARACVTSGLHTLSVSLDGATATTYEAARRKASFGKVLRNLDRLVAERDAARSPLQVRGVVVLMRGNLHELPPLVRLLHDHGVHALLVQRLSSDLHQPDLPARYIPIRRYVDEAELHEDDRPRMAAVFDAARALARSLSFTLHLPKLPGATAASRPDGDRGRGRCTWPLDQLYLTAAGELLPCCMVATADRASFGNVFDPGEDLASRWHGPAAQSFRAALAGDDPPAVCRSCALYRGEF